jgi:thiol:disulfide interchange protein
MSVGLSKLFTVSIFNIVMCVVVFAMSLSLMGIWELSAPAFLGRGESVKLMSKEGFVGAFFKGIITTLLAIPCGAPLLSPAISWSDQQIRSGQTTLVILVYATIGIGMGLPYLIIGAFPELLRFLPKPGEWMETFRKTMGFALLIAVVWILYFIELAKIVPMITLLFAIWYACWSIGRLDITTRITQRLTAWLTSLALVIVVTLFTFNIPFIKMPVTLENAMQRRLENWAGLRTEGHWASYSHKRFEQELIENKRTVLIDFTADWCANCKFLEATVLESKEVIEAVENKNIVTFRADCTKSDQEGTQLLRRLGAESVPTMAIFNPENPTEPQIIRGNYHAATLLQQLE